LYFSGGDRVASLRCSFGDKSLIIVELPCVFIPTNEGLSPPLFEGPGDALSFELVHDSAEAFLSSAHNTNVAAISKHHPSNSSSDDTVGSAEVKQVNDAVAVFSFDQCSKFEPHTLLRILSTKVMCAGTRSLAPVAPQGSSDDTCSDTQKGMDTIGGIKSESVLGIGGLHGLSGLPDGLGDLGDLDLPLFHRQLLLLAHHYQGQHHAGSLSTSPVPSSIFSSSTSSSASSSASSSSSSVPLPAPNLSMDDRLEKLKTLFQGGKISDNTLTAQSCNILHEYGY
jgi:hypothetical protein